MGTSTTPPAAIEPMLPGHVDEVAALWRAAFGPPVDASAREEGRTPAEAARDRARFVHLLETDPAGAFVATSGGAVLGFCQSALRGGRFVLARLGVRPGDQDRGIGRALLRAALGYAEHSTEQYVFSSRDPRALHSYVQEGFTLRPTVHLTGRAREAPMAPTVRRADRHALSSLCAIDEATTKTVRAADLRFWLDTGASVYLDDEGGYAIVSQGRLVTLTAVAQTIAHRLLAPLLCGYEGDPPVEVGWVVADQQWAIRCASECRASIANSGAMMTRGVAALFVPYLPNPLLG